MKLDSVVCAFATVGFSPCLTSELEDGIEKVALYLTNGIVEHAARQETDGTWSSKVGLEEDVAHNTLDALAGGRYGTEFKFLCRPRGQAPNAPPT
jgi:hypothetical protein